MATRELSWLDIVQRADPDHSRAKRYVIEYEFSSRERGDERTHEAGMRVFRGNYEERGPYRAETIVAEGLMWNGIPLSVGDEQLSWDE